MSKSSLSLLVWILLLCGCVWETTDDFPSSLPLNDSEYPYAGIPRFVVETENFASIRNTETKHRAWLQIYGDSVPEGEPIPLEVKGRGNSSFLMPKYGIKLDFDSKVSLLGMRPGKKFALLSNYGDKTLLKNVMTMTLSRKLGFDYTPDCRMVEVYLNREYLGVYVLMETIEVSKNRVDIPKDGSAYLVEVDGKYRVDEQVVFSKKNYPFRVHYPKNANEQTLKKLQDYLNGFENILFEKSHEREMDLSSWIDVDDYVKYYWVQEYSGNVDACFCTSVYFVWREGGTIRMGPLWDFDLAYGGYENGKEPETWRIRECYWNEALFGNESFKVRVQTYWAENSKVFESMVDSLDAYYERYAAAAENNFRRWKILGDTRASYHHHGYSTYKEAVEDLKKWMMARSRWINENMEK